MRFKTTIAVTILALALAAAPSAAKKDMPTKDKERRQEMREKVERRLETLMMMRVAEDMNLAAEKEEKLLFMLKKSLTERKKHAENMQRAMKNLQDAYEKATSDADLENAIRKLEKIQKQRTSLETDFIEKLRKTLTTKEAARFILLWPKIEQEMRSTIQDMKGMRGRGKMQNQRMEHRPQEPGHMPPDSEHAPPEY